jgi:hypothetical protein
MNQIPLINVYITLRTDGATLCYIVFDVTWRAKNTLVWAGQMQLILRGGYDELTE